jgi:hypothetical protein
MPLVGSRKILPVLLAWRNSDRRAVKVWRRRLPVSGVDGGQDVGGGDLTQVPVASGPVQQQRLDPVEVHPHGVLVAGAAAWTAVLTGVQPVLDVGGHRRGQCRQPGLLQMGERGDAVVVQEPGQGEDLGSAGDAQIPWLQGRRQVGPGDQADAIVLGQDDGKGPAGLEGEFGTPAADLGEFSGDASGQFQRLVGDGGGDPVTSSGQRAFAEGKELQLHLPGVER